LEIAAQGVRNKDIAVALGLTEGTIKQYIRSIYKKYGIDNRRCLQVLAIAATDGFAAEEETRC